MILNPFAPGDFAEKRVLKLVEWFSGHCRAVEELNVSIIFLLLLILDRFFNPFDCLNHS